MEVPTTDLDPSRFDDPLYTIAEAARIVDVPPSTLSSWARGYVRRPPNRREVRGEPIVTYRESYGPKHPSIPFVGLTEATVLAAIRKSGVPMQRIRPALTRLEQGLGLRHSLAHKKLYTDGAELLYDFSERHPDDAGRAARRLVVIRNRQCVFTEVIEEYLQGFQYSVDGYVELFRVPGYRRAEVVVDPTRSSGAPIFVTGGYRVEDLVFRFLAGESISELEEEFGVPEDHIEDAIRVASRRAA